MSFWFRSVRACMAVEWSHAAYKWPSSVILLFSSILIKSLWQVKRRKKKCAKTSAILSWFFSLHKEKQKQNILQLANKNGQPIWTYFIGARCSSLISFRLFLCVPNDRPFIKFSWCVHAKWYLQTVYKINGHFKKSHYQSCQLISISFVQFGHRTRQTKCLEPKQKKCFSKLSDIYLHFSVNW